MAACGVESANDNTGSAEEIMPEDLTEEDITIVNELNQESNLLVGLYEDMGNGDEPYEINGDGVDSFIAVKIPKNGDTLRVKEIDLQDEEYDLYGMSVGIPRTDFEDKIVQKGFSKDTELDSMRYVSYKNGNVYIGISYDENDNVSRLFVNLLLDYTEWRGVE